MTPPPRGLWSEGGHGPGGTTCPAQSPWRCERCRREWRQDSWRQDSWEQGSSRGALGSGRIFLAQLLPPLCCACPASPGEPEPEPEPALLRGRHLPVSQPSLTTQKLMCSVYLGPRHHPLPVQLKLASLGQTPAPCPLGQAGRRHKCHQNTWSVLALRDSAAAPTPGAPHCPSVVGSAGAAGT